MELGVLVVLAGLGVGIGWFWINGIKHGTLRMQHRP
jgi:hypothetical protein